MSRACARPSPSDASTGICTPGAHVGARDLTSRGDRRDDGGGDDRSLSGRPPLSELPDFALGNAAPACRRRCRLRSAYLPCDYRLSAGSRICHENSFSVKVGSCGFGLWFEGDVIAEAFEAPFEVGDGSGLADLVEIGFSEVVVRQPFVQHVIGADENFVGDGEGGAQGAATSLEAVEFVLEVAALGPGGGDRGADQDGAQVDIALPGPAALLPAGALVAARADAGPGAQVIDAY